MDKQARNPFEEPARSKNDFYKSQCLVEPTKRARYQRADFQHEKKNGDSGDVKWGALK